jgi:hypothetical protein
MCNGTVRNPEASGWAKNTSILAINEHNVTALLLEVSDSTF